MKLWLNNTDKNKKQEKKYNKKINNNYKKYKNIKKN
jgi:hypothetical protein